MTSTAKRKLEILQFQLHHRLSKFDRPLVVNLKHIFELLYKLLFDLETIGVNFGEKAKIKKAGNLNSGRSYLITTVTKKKFKLAFEEINKP